MADLVGLRNGVAMGRIYSVQLEICGDCLMVSGFDSMWLSIRRAAGCGVLSNGLFAVSFIVMRSVCPPSWWGWLDFLLLFLASVALPVFCGPSSVLTKILIGLYSLVSNVFLTVILVCSVFGLAL